MMSGGTSTTIGENDGKDMHRTHTWVYTLHRAITHILKAAAGAIMKVELVNFMCHKNLHVELSPKINFITGYNGSGKSAILTAISVCLCGTSNFTNRANSLKEFIREGASVAAVSITISNRGEDAYKPSVYGDCIVIQRQIMSDGTTAYSVKSEKDVIISRKRDDIMAICDHMQIHPKNPLVILTQDKARSFLSNSTPHEKYKFFQAGTRLSELNNEYQIIRNTLDTQRNFINLQKQNLEALRLSISDLEEKWTYLQKTGNLHARLSELKNMLGWSIVGNLKSEYVSKEEELKKTKKRIQQLSESISGTDKSIEENTVASQVNQEKLTLILSNAEPLKNEREELAKKLKAVHQTLQTHHNELKSINATVETHTTTKEYLTKKLEEEKKRVAYLDGLGEEKSSIENMTKKLNDELDTLNKELEDRSVDLKEFEKFSAKNKMEFETMGEDIRVIKRKIQNHKFKLEEFKNRQRNKYHVFGPGLKDAMDIIEKNTQENRWKGPPPIGPLGCYIKVLKTCFSQVINELIGSSLNAFAVKTQEDLILLKEIFTRTKCLYKIWKYDTETLDYSSGEPSEDYSTLLRVIKISNRVLLNQLILNHHIEKIILTTSHQEAIKITENGFPKNVSGVFSDDCRSFGNRAGGLSTQAMHISNKPSRLIENLDVYIDEENKHISDLEDEMRTKETHLEKIEGIIENDAKKKSEIKSSIGYIEQKIMECQDKIMQLKEGSREIKTANIRNLTEAIESEQNVIDNLLRQQDKLAQECSTCSSEEQILYKKLKEIDSQLQEMRKEHDSVASLVTDLMTKELKIKNENTHRKEQLARYTTKENEILKDLVEAKETYQKEREKCLLLCEEIETDSTPQALESEIKSVECKIKMLEKEYGSYGMVGVELTRRKDIYIQAKDRIETVEKFLDDANTTLAIRMDRWRQFRNYFSSRAKQIYSLLMKKRGYRGRMLLDHDNCTLKLLVESFQNPQERCKRKLVKQQDKDPRSLSGGERSFSTICLLLALWEGIVCPFRALDEFDVFMDAVNRRQSMYLMLESSKESNRDIQYIFITPQSLGHLKNFDKFDIRVHLLSEPERSQRVSKS